MYNFDFPQICTTCRGYKTMPFNWSSIASLIMCNCPKEQTLAWKCPRCYKINAPWKSSCDCGPTSFNSSTCATLPDPKGATTITAKIYNNEM